MNDRVGSCGLVRHGRGSPRPMQDGGAEPLACQEGQLDLQAALAHGMPEGVFGLADPVLDTVLVQDEAFPPASGKPLFQAATANLNPWTEAKVDTHNPDRGRLLIISGEKDHTVPLALVKRFTQGEKEGGSHAY